MDFMPVIIPLLVVNFSIMLYTIIQTRKSAFHADSKLLLYIMAVGAPVLGLILYFIKRKKADRLTVK
ncbi:MAG: hypothetical protein ACK5WV_13075 [Chryseotalea sp.]|jgi:hypothetical protein|nr:hypothetical protein [Flammeovirgaceae bacterium]